MANIKITDLTAYANPASTDVLPIVDVGENITKRVSIADLLENAGSGTAAAPGIAFDGDNTGTGIYHPGAGQVAISTNGTERVEFGTSEVVFNDGGANYDFRIEGDTEANLFFVDASTDRVGLGTSSPGGKLEVSGGYVIFRSGASSYPDGISAPLIYGSTGGGSGTFEQTGNLVLQTRSDAGNYSICMVTGDTPTERLRIDYSGRVGIGTTTVSAKLHIAGATGGGVAGIWDTTAGGARVEYKDNGTRRGFLNWDTNSLNLAADSGNSIKFSTDAGATQHATIDSSGRLLVGTSSSTNVGSTVGAVQQIRYASGVGLSVTRDGAASNIVLARTGAAPASIVSSGDLIGDIRWAGADGTDIETQAASIGCYVDGTPGTDDMPGRLVFSTTPDGDSSPDEVMRITSDKYVRLASGTGGIQFGGDTAAANALDDYEEGTWTPTIAGSTTAGAGSYANRVGRYTKIGNTIFFKAYVIWSAHTGTGNLLLTGLPFTSDATSGTFSSVQFASVSDLTLLANNIALGGYIANNSTQCDFTQTPVGGGTATAIGFDAAGNLILSGYYTV